MAYPSTVTAFVNPLPTDRLNSPSHSSIETAQNNGLTELQTFLGTTGSSTVGTIIYDVRSPSSDGGGHVQGVNKGGTGFVSYTKGDLLIATSSSVLAKLSVGSDNQVLAANSSVASGINWVNDSSNKIATSASVVTVLNTNETSIMSLTVPGSTLGMNNAVRTNLFVPSWNPDTGVSVLAAVHYGGMRVASVMFTSTGANNDSSVMGVFRHTMVANDSPNLQRHFLEADFVTRTTGGVDNTVFTMGNPNNTSVIALKAMSRNTSSINSAASQTYGMTIKMTGVVNRDLSTGGYTVEQIT